MEFGPKLLVNYTFFADRVAAFAEPALVLLGERSLNDDCTLERASTAAGWKAMLANCVIGLGLFQGMEFIFGRSLSEIAAKLIVAGDRLLASHRLLGRSEVYHLKLGRDSERNAEVVLTALRRGGKIVSRFGGRREILLILGAVDFVSSPATTSLGMGWIQKTTTSTSSTLRADLASQPRTCCSGRLPRSMCRTRCPIVVQGDYTISVGGGQPDTGAPAVNGHFQITGQIALPE